MACLIKIRVGIDWLLELLFSRDITKVELHRTETLQRAHFSQGEVIVRQGEIGDCRSMQIPVDVLILSRRDCQSLVRGFNLFHDQFRTGSSVPPGAPDSSKEKPVQ